MLLPEQFQHIGDGIFVHVMPNEQLFFNYITNMMYQVYAIFGWEVIWGQLQSWCGENEMSLWISAYVRMLLLAAFIFVLELVMTSITAVRLIARVSAFLPSNGLPLYQLL